MQRPGFDVQGPPLNAAQAAAVAHGEGPLLVFAGAGSGKTRVITYRVAHLVEAMRVPPRRILAVTFTNKAAGEMRERLEKLLGGVAGEAWVGTFHSTCARLLRRYHESASLPRDFVIYDDADQRSVVGRVLKELGYDDRRYPPRLMLSRIMKEKQEGRGPAELVSESYVDDVARAVFEGYERYMRASGAVDFEDLIGLTARLGEDQDSLAGRELRERFWHVLVDEFQDTNRMQYRLVRALAARRNLVVVGDDDQSIYRWRGGDVRLIRNFRHDYPDAQIVKLEENYRSSGHIVRSALGVIRPSAEREPKELYTNNAAGAKVRVVGLRDERDEALYVVARTKEALAAGVDATRVAVFYRIHAMSRVLEEVFRLEGVPYRVVGGTRFFDRAEVKDLVAYLRLAANPRSDVDFVRVVNVPARGIGQNTIEKLVEHATARGTSLYDALDSLDASALGAAPRKKLAAFRATVDGFREAAGRTSPSDLARRVLAETGYLAMLEAENSAESDARRENLQELLASMAEYEEAAASAGEPPTLSGYLERVSLASSPDEERSMPRVSLMTVHSAKGLEYEVVFLVGMEEQIFPYARGGDEESIDEEEERRLAYVAVTRARQRLHLTHVAMRTIFGNTRCSGPSRFLGDLPPDSVEEIKPAGNPFVRAQPAWAPNSSFRSNPPASSGGYRGGRGAGRSGPPSYGGAGRSGPPAYGAGRPAIEAGPPPSGGAAYGRGAPGGGAAPAPGERYVERDEGAADGGGEAVALRVGSRVRHPRFGEGRVQSVHGGSDPAVVANFPGWGEKKVLVRFLQPA